MLGNSHFMILFHNFFKVAYTNHHHHQHQMWPGLRNALTVSEIDTLVECAVLAVSASVMLAAPKVQVTGYVITRLQNVPLNEGDLVKSNN